MYLRQFFFSVQKQFLIFALRKFKWRDKFHLPPYKDRLLLFHMNTLEDRRKINQILFIASLINGKISSPKLLSELNIRARQVRTRDTSHFFSRTNMNNENPFCIIKKICNENFKFFDLHKSNDSIKQNLKTHFATIILVIPFRQTCFTDIGSEVSASILNLLSIYSNIFRLHIIFFHTT